MQRPFCGQCVSRGLKCDGYEHQMLFINTTTDGPPPRRQHRRQPRNEQQSRQPNSAQSLLLLPGPGNDKTLTWSAYEESYFGLFWNAYLPHGRQLTSQVMGYTSGG